MIITYKSINNALTEYKQKENNYDYEYNYPKDNTESESQSIRLARELAMANNISHFY